jgi:hypothetical protein
MLCIASPQFTTMDELKKWLDGEEKTKAAYSGLPLGAAFSLLA